MIRFSKVSGSNTQLHYNKGNITIHTTEKPIFIQSIKDANFIDILACNYLNFSTHSSTDSCDCCYSNKTYCKKIISKGQTVGNFTGSNESVFLGFDTDCYNTNPSYSLYIVKNVKEFINNFSEHNNLVELSSQSIFKFGDCVFDRFHYYGLLGGCYDC